MQSRISYGGSMDWQSSPAQGVRRKRLFHRGPAESGVVTSVVEFAAGAAFPEHGHPEGEEVLVLDGTYSDERGDFSRGSYLLNPEGFQHAPYSRQGCTLFVKLRQYAGSQRERVHLETTRGKWTEQLPRSRGQVRSLPLYRSQRYPEDIQLLELAAGAELAASALRQASEIFVVSGEFEDAHGVYPTHSWLLLPAGAAHGPRSRAGAVLYVRQGGF